MLADTGSIGGSESHEFHVLADSGEDAIAFSSTGEFAANVEKAEALAPAADCSAPLEENTLVATPGAHTIAAVAALLELPESQLLKTLVVDGCEDGPALVALVLRGDHQLNAVKAQSHPLVASPLRLADEAAIADALGCRPGSLGPVGIGIPVLVDRSALAVEQLRVWREPGRLITCAESTGAGTAHPPKCAICATWSMATPAPMGMAP